MHAKRKVLIGIALWLTATILYSCTAVSTDAVHSPEGTIKKVKAR